MRVRNSASPVNVSGPTTTAILAVLIVAGVSLAQPGGGRSSGPGRGPSGPSIGPGAGGPGHGNAGRGPGPAPAAGVPHQAQPVTPVPPPPPAARSTPFTPAWYGQHPDAWQHPQPYAEWRSSPLPPAVVVNTFFGGTSPANPALAAAVASEWLPFGVFTPPMAAGAAPTTFQQIAAAKTGEIKGVFYDATSNTVQPIAGRVDPATRVAAWSVGASGSVSFETTLDELTKPAPTVTVVTAGGRQPGQLVLSPVPH